MTKSAPYRTTGLEAHPNKPGSARDKIFKALSKAKNGLTIEQLQKIGGAQTSQALANLVKRGLIA